MKFSQYYLSPREYVTDSEKLRRRVGSYVHSLGFKTKYSKVTNLSIGNRIKQYVGINISMYKTTGYLHYFNFEKLFLECDIVDLLDSISEIYSILNYSDKYELTTFINNCFEEEGIAYVLNERGEVRFRPDEEFERNRVQTLKNLTDSKFSAVLEAFNSAYNAFQTTPTKSKSALRDIFEANEILFKKITKPQHMFDQLNSKNIEKSKGYILRKIEAHYDKTAKQSLNKLLESYKSWVDAIHPYRHGQDIESYDNPPVDLAILALSNGASYLRMLASIIETVN